jgi:tetratricopeptide (TPR) repeat protein
MALIETKSYARAVDDLDRAIQLEPGNAQAYYQRGLARERDDQRAKAIADYKMALAYDDHMSEARQALARAIADERRHKPLVAAREDKAEPAVKERDQTARDDGDAPKPAQNSKDDKKETNVDKNELKVDNKAARTDKVDENTSEKKTTEKKTYDKKAHDQKTTQHAKEGKNSRNLPDRKTAERHLKQREHDARSHKERQKAAARKPEKHKAVAAPPRERNRRAGAPDLRRRDTRFSEIWNDRR